MKNSSETNGQRIYIVDDDTAVRDSLGFLLDSVGLDASSFASAAAFLEAYDNSHGVLVLDVRMPSMSGLELQALLAERGCTKLKIIFISGHGDIEMAVEALKRGATDFLAKPFRDQDLLDRIHQAIDGNRAQLEKTASAAHTRERLESLTPRERDVLEMVADGKANKVVAMDLDISQRTVEIHRAHVMEKMQVASLAQLIRQLHRVNYFND
ncbi:MAG: response regulator transcription factor [Gammaproteobacteria bacterium]